ncbi:MAG: hypothetical protein ACW98J_07075 [Candidatus Thorarchaeota archaeon]|jgi:hypothetical protein
MSDDELCRYHQEAFSNLKTAYEGWKKATGMNWEEYIGKIVQIEETGRWVVDVIEHITQQGDPLEEM